MKAAPLLLGLAAAAALTAEAEGCSIVIRPQPYDVAIAGLREAHFADFVRGAHFIDVATPYSTTPSEEQPVWMSRDGLEALDFVFHSNDRLKGDSARVFVSSLGFDHAISAEAAGETYAQYLRFADSAAQDASWWDWGELPEVGIGLWGPGDCSTVLTFEIGEPYLVMRDADGAFLSAAPVAGDDDPWVVAVRRLVEDPSLERGWAMNLEEYVRRHNRAAAYVVEDCTRPVMRRTEMAGEWDEWSEREDAEISGPAATQSEYIALALSRHSYASETQRRTSAEEGWAFDDENRFFEFPFEASSCEIGAQYLTFTRWMPVVPMFPIDADGIVDFTGYASQIEITGPLEASLDDVMAWVGTHPALNRETAHD